MSTRAFAIVMGALGLVALLAFGLLQKADGGIAVGEPLPQASLPFLDPATSGTAALADYEGDWVLANVWASWCEPCRSESPALERFSREHRGEVTVVGIATQDNTDDGLAFVEELGLSYEQLHDGSGDYAEEIGTTGVPESILIDPQGRVALHVPGAVTEETLRTRIEPLLRGGEA
jgi:cytochrome c biogenesis protein CcmG/thiol:disulfide interchange protein DsbE